MGAHFKVELTVQPSGGTFTASFPRRFNRKQDALDCIAEVEAKDGKAVLVNLDKRKERGIPHRPQGSSIEGV